MKKYLSILLAIMMVLGLTACKGKTNPSPQGPSVTMPSVEDSKNNSDVVAIQTPASTTQQDWFNLALKEYIQSQLNIDNYYLNATIFDAKDDMNAENALTRASAMITLCVDSNTINKDKASDFSDGLARKFALDKASGSISFSIYRIPHDIYVQITDANYNTAIKESTGIDGFSKFSFSYGGTGDVILESPSKETPSVTPSSEPVDDTLGEEQEPTSSEAPENQVDSPEQEPIPQTPEDAQNQQGETPTTNTNGNN